MNFKFTAEDTSMGSTMTSKEYINKTAELKIDHAVKCLELDKYKMCVIELTG